MKSTGDPTLHFPHSELWVLSLACSQWRDSQRNGQKARSKSSKRKRTDPKLNTHKVKQLKLSTSNFLAEATAQSQSTQYPGDHASRTTIAFITSWKTMG